jgi:hypothetical protein
VNTHSTASLPTGMNSSAIYVFLLLQWLLEAPRTVEDIQANYQEHPWCGKKISDDSIRIYLNTLRMLGCEIERPKGKNKFQYHLKGQPFSLQNPQNVANVLLKQFNQLETTTDTTVILQRYSAITAMLSYCGIPLSQWQQLKFPPLQTPSFLPNNGCGVTLPQLINYTQPFTTPLPKSVIITYEPPHFNTETDNEATSVTLAMPQKVIHTWEVIPGGLLHERGRLYWICLEIPSNPGNIGIKRLLRYDRICSIQPQKSISTTQQQRLTKVLKTYLDSLPTYRFLITCPVGINFKGLGFPQESFTLHPPEEAWFNSTTPQQHTYVYQVHTGLTFLLQQRLCAIVGTFTILEAPHAFKESIQQWLTETLQQYQ